MMHQAGARCVAAACRLPACRDTCACLILLQSNRKSGTQTPPSRPLPYPLTPRAAMCEAEWCVPPRKRCVRQQSLTLVAALETTTASASTMSSCTNPASSRTATALTAALARRTATPRAHIQPASAHVQRYAPPPPFAVRRDTYHDADIQGEPARREPHPRLVRRVPRGRMGQP